MNYKIVMMSKDEIRIDADEIPKVLKAIASGMPAIVKQGIFNPSSYSHIIEDTNRPTKMAAGGGYQDVPLKDIFPGIQEKLAEISDKMSDTKRLRSYPGQGEGLTD